MDARVAEGVMGIALDTDVWGNPVYADGPKTVTTTTSDTRQSKTHGMWIPAYSTNVAEAWGVVERLLAGGFNVSVISLDGAWEVDVYDEARDVCVAIGEADTAPLAICRAALQALNTPTDSEVITSISHPTRTTENEDPLPPREET